MDNCYFLYGVVLETYPLSVVVTSLPSSASQQSTEVSPFLCFFCLWHNFPLIASVLFVRLSVLKQCSFISVPWHVVKCWYQIFMQLSVLKSTEECSSLILSDYMLCCCLIVAVTEQQVVVAITPKICICEVLSSNFSCDACYPDRVSHGFPQSL
jgi:hypothetical protein